MQSWSEASAHDYTITWSLTIMLNNSFRFTCADRIAHSLRNTPNLYTKCFDRITEVQKFAYCLGLTGGKSLETCLCSSLFSHPTELAVHIVVQNRWNLILTVK
jgi:hypothetical protein